MKNQGEIPWKNRLKSLFLRLSLYEVVKVVKRIFSWQLVTIEDNVQVIKVVKVVRKKHNTRYVRCFFPGDRGFNYVYICVWQKIGNFDNLDNFNVLTGTYGLPISFLLDNR